MSKQGSNPRPIVLLAEDEPLVRMFNTDVLDEAGYRVVEAANGEEPLSLFEARPDVRGVITDGCRHPAVSVRPPHAGIIA